MKHRLRLSHLIAETMALKEEPREPMTIHVRMEIDGALARVPMQKWKEATDFLLRSLPRIGMGFCLEETGYVWRPGVGMRTEDLVEVVWSLQGKSLSEFRTTVFDPARGPLVRLRVSDDDGFCMAVHHSLADGKAIIDWIGFLFAYVLEDETDLSVLSASRFLARASNVVPATLPKGVSRMRWVRDVLERLVLGWVAPPRFTGAIANRFGTRHFFAEATLDAKSAHAILEEARRQAPRVTWNDLVLTAYHRALSARVRKRAKVFAWPWLKDRTSVLVSVNLRPWLSIPDPVCNWSSYLSSHSFAHQSAGPIESHLSAVSEAMRKKKMAGAAFSMIRVMELAEKLGVFAKSRTHRLRTGNPLRIQNGRVMTSGWRYLETAVLSNLGRLPADFPGLKCIRAFYGVAPVFPPSGIALGTFGSANGLHFCLQASDASLACQRDADALLADLVGSLRELGGQSRGGDGADQSKFHPNEINAASLCDLELQGKAASVDEVQRAN